MKLKDNQKVLVLRTNRYKIKQNKTNKDKEEISLRLNLIQISKKKIKQLIMNKLPKRVTPVDGDEKQQDLDFLNTPIEPKLMEDKTDEKPANKADKSNVISKLPDVKAEKTNIPNFAKEAMQESLSNVSPEALQAKVTEEQISKIVGNLANTFGIEAKHAYIAIILLFLKGAASSSTPLTLSVTVVGKEITKRDLVNSYSLVAKNNYLRRLAEAMAEMIGQFAQKNGLNGELAKRIEGTVRAAGEPSLTTKEKAWCSSFSQAVDNLDELSGSERLSKLLHQDYDKRFSKKQIKKQSSTNNGSQQPNANKNNQQKPQGGKKTEERKRSGKRANSTESDKKGQK